MRSTFTIKYIKLKMLTFIAILTTLLALFDPSDCAATKVPGLYIDKMTAGSISTYLMTPSSSGYDFSHSWRETLPATLSSGLSLYNFQVYKNSMLSFISTITAISTTGVTVNIKTDMSYSNIHYLAFSIIVITRDNSNVELLQVSDVSAGSGSYYVTSTKFNFKEDSVEYTGSFAWITASNPSSGNYDNYWAYLYTTTTSSSDYKLKITFSHDTTYLKGFKIVVLIANLDSTDSYTYSAKDGSSFSRNFRTNFGIDTGNYGEPGSSEYCIFGLTRIDLYYYTTVYSYNYGSQFLFTYSGNQVIDIKYQHAYGVLMEVACFGTKTPGINVGIIVGAVLGGICLLVIIVACGCYCVRKWREERRINQIVRMRENMQASNNNIMPFGFIHPPIRHHSINQMWNVNAVPFHYQPPQARSYNWAKPQNTYYRQTQCSICLEGSTEVMTGCGHFFHLKCIVSWLKKTDNCPNCRFCVRNQWFEMVCKFCCLKGLWINTDSMLRMSLVPANNRERLCEECRQLKPEEIIIEQQDL